MRRVLTLAALLSVATAACDGMTIIVQPSRTATIIFTLRSEVRPLPADPLQAAQVQYCVRHLLGRSSLAFSFSESDYYLNESTPGVAEVVVTGIPIGTRQFVVTRDVHQCAVDPGGSGITVQGLFANGVRLTRVMPYPDAGASTPSLAFIVTADGEVEP